MSKTVIIHGGTGGERKFFAPDLCKHFECDAFILGWNQDDIVNVGCLHLTQSYTPQHQGKTVTVDEDLNVVGETIVMPFAKAMAAAGFKQYDRANKLREMKKSAALKQANFDFRSGRISYDQLREIEKRVKEGREPTTEDDEFTKLRAEFDKLHVELNHHKARNESKSKLIRRLRDRLQEISDHIEDEGDRKYFGSTNDADDLTELVIAMANWRWDDILSKDEGHTDPYADLREQRARAEKAEAEVAHQQKRNSLLEAALNVAMGKLAPQQLPDSRAVDDWFVACAAVQCDLPDDDGRIAAVLADGRIAAVLADDKKEPVSFVTDHIRAGVNYPEFHITKVDGSRPVYLATLKTIYEKAEKPTRYAVFAGSTYYPSGGAADFIGFIDGINEAPELIKEAVKRYVGHGRSVEELWAHAMDTSSGAVIPIPGYARLRSHVGSSVREDIDPKTGEWSL